MTPMSFICILVCWSLICAVLITILYDKLPMVGVYGTIVCLAGIVVLVAASPTSSEMRMNKAIATLKSKPDCVEEQYVSIECLEDYKEWLVDSIAAKAELAKFDAKRDSLWMLIKALKKEF